MAEMAIASEVTPTDFDYDVFISYPRSERAWADRLARELDTIGLRCFSDADLTVGEPWEAALQAALSRSRALVLIWSRKAEGSTSVLRELAMFQVQRREDGSRPVIPVVLGGGEVLREAPREVLSLQALILGPQTYAAGAESDSEEWLHLVDEIARLVTAAFRGHPVGILRARSGEQAAFPSFSRAARRALTFAADMLGDEGSDRVRLRTAALLGALRTSALGGMTPTTGDVVRLVLDRQVRGRTAEEVIAAAGLAAGLRVGDREVSGMSLDELAISNVRQLVYEAADLQQRTAADGVHLRHVSELAFPIGPPGGLATRR